mmetsp:Transcript_28970/g.26315  ORF Transcript_28970/g.26315 Transcript_28970/m.26315 type:complete len:290 (+) Transcript_28970:116-985(+)
MKAPPAWSIGTSRRSTDWKAGSYSTPGPGSYEYGNFRKTNSPSYRIGTAPRPDLRKSDAPGPGAYDSPGKITKSSPRYHFGMKTETSIKNFNPGPGSYDTSRLVGTERRPPSYSMSTKAQPPDSRMNNPGPGAYDLSSRVLNKSVPSMKIGTSKRDEIYRCEKTPGPGTYSRPQSAYGKDSGPKFPFGTQSRDGLGSMSKTMPGPGSYDTGFKWDKTGKGTTILPRRPDSAHLALSRVPGPGEYQPSLESARKRPPSCKIGTASRDGLSNMSRTLPGPGQYNWERPRSK